MPDDLFGFLDPNVPKELAAPDGYAGVHQPGMSWARQGDRLANTSWITARQYNHIIAQFRGLATLAGVDVSDLIQSSPLLLRTFIQRTIEAVLSGVDLGDDYKVMRKADYDADEDGHVDLAAGGTGVEASDAADLRDKIGVTSAIDTAISALGAVVVNKGSWDASAGTFPGSGAARNGWAYIVSVAGTVDGVAFAVGDRVLALADDASTSTYAGNWLKLDYTDQVLSVVGLTGAITQAALEAALTGLMPKAGGTFTGATYFNTGEGSSDLNSITAPGFYVYTSTTANAPAVSDFGSVIHLARTADRYIQLAIGSLGSPAKVYVRNKGGAGWSAWKTVITDAGGALTGATGGDPGAGKINATDYQINGESVADALAAKADAGDLAAVATSGSYNDLADKPSALSAVPNAVLEDQKTSGTAGGTFNSGAWQTRTLNTVVRDPDSRITLSSNEFTPSVSGWVEWSAVAQQVDNHQTRLYCVTDSVAVGYGAVQRCSHSPSTGNESFGGAAVEAGKAYRLEHQCSTTETTNGFGNPGGFGTEIYARVKFWQT